MAKLIIKDQTIELVEVESTTLEDGTIETVFETNHKDYFLVRVFTPTK